MVVMVATLVALMAQEAQPIRSLDFRRAIWAESSKSLTDQQRSIIKCDPCVTFSFEGRGVVARRKADLTLRAEDIEEVIIGGSGDAERSGRSYTIIIRPKRKLVPILLGPGYITAAFIDDRIVVLYPIVAEYGIALHVESKSEARRIVEWLGVTTVIDVTSPQTDQ